MARGDIRGWVEEVSSVQDVEVTEVRSEMAEMSLLEEALPNSQSCRVSPFRHR